MPFTTESKHLIGWLWLCKKWWTKAFGQNIFWQETKSWWGKDTDKKSVRDV